MMTGYSDISDVGKIYSWNGQKYLLNFDYFNKIAQT